MGLVVFSDLDGTLLDHHAYTFAPARPAIEALAERGVPLILCSSKTRAEMQELWSLMGLTHPFIAENGGGIYAPPGHPMAWGPAWEDAGGGWLLRHLGLPIGEVRRRFGAFKDNFGARGFGDLSDEEVTELTGLNPHMASLARKREFNEPVVLPERCDEAAFLTAAAEAGLDVAKGGRFHHLLRGADKGKAVALVKKLLGMTDSNLRVMALGDAPNDLPMLREADRAVLVARHDGTHAALSLPGLELEPLAGPCGFNHAVLTELMEA